jgi:hypothetical protein
MTPEQAQEIARAEAEAAAAAKVGVGEDVLRSAPSGLKRGVELLGGTAEGGGNTAAWAIGKLARALGVPEETVKGIEQTVQTGVSAGLNPIGGASKLLKAAGGPDLTHLYAPSADTLKADTESIVPALKDVNYAPQTLPGKIVHKAGEIGPSVAAFGPGGLLTRGLVTAGGAVGEEGTRAGAEKLNTMLPDEWKLSPGEVDAASFGGSVIGSLAAPSAWNRLSRPFPAEPGRADLAAQLDRQGVSMTAGQRTGNEKLLYKESVAGDIPALREQGPELVDAAARTQGGFPPGTNTLTRDAMSSELNRMGQEFERMASISEAPMDQTLLDRFVDVVTRYKENPITGGRVERIVNDLFDNSQQQGGRITGQGYKDANSKITDIIRNTADDAEREAMMDLKNALDDAVGQNLPAAEQDAWRRVRQQYRDFLPIEKAKAQSSPTAARGVITPAALRTGVKSVEGAREVAAGDRPMTALSEAGQGIMEKPPNSGTAPRSREDLARRIMEAVTSGSTAGGGAAMMGMPGPLAAILGTGTGLATAIAPAIRDAYVRSGIGQRLMARQGPVANRAGLTTLLSELQQMQDQRER